MSLIPSIFDDFYYPRGLSHRLGHLSLDTPDDLFNPWGLSTYHRQHPFFRSSSWMSPATESTALDLNKKDQFMANIDVQQFKPDEITVKVTGDNTITVEGKHEEKQDEHGFISRHFVRRYVLPSNCDLSKIQSKLSSDGVLSITAPKVAEGQAKDQSRDIPITQTGAPAKQVENKEQAQEQPKEQK